MNFSIFQTRPQMQHGDLVFEAGFPFDGGQLLDIHLNPMPASRDRVMSPRKSGRPEQLRLSEDATNRFPVRLGAFGLEGHGDPHRAMRGMRLTIRDDRHAIRVRDHRAGMGRGRTRILRRGPMRPFRRCFPIDVKLGG